MTIDTTDLIKALEERKRQLSKWTDKDRAKERIDEIDCIIDTDIPYLVKEESEDSVHADLEEAAKKEYPCDKSYMTPDMLDLNAHKQVAFRKGAKWDRQQMLKEAVVYVAEPETPIGNILMPFIRIDHSVLFRYGIKVGDKVRIIILKEDKK